MIYRDVQPLPPLTNREELYRWAFAGDPTTHVRLELRQYRQLSPTDRDAYDEDRMRLHLNLPFVIHSRHAQFQRLVMDTLSNAQYRRSGNFRHLLLNGIATIGKSRSVAELAAEIIRDDITENGAVIYLPDPDEDTDRTPVWMIEIGGINKDYELFNRILRYNGAPPSGTTEHRRQQVIELIVKRKVRLIILDDASGLRQSAASRLFMDHFKSFHNDTGVTFLVVTSDFADSALTGAKGAGALQMRRRMRVTEWADLSAPSTDPQREFERVIASFEGSLRLLKHKTGTLLGADFVKELYDGSDGSIGNLGEWIGVTANHVMKRQGSEIGTEAIRLRDLKATHPGRK